ncbi:MAG TPA: hypothetical protein VHR45_24220 [Thermoanaerobaculia bacterium]|nr:hypothetical protein [Thermoanaerobaculia bacterium]
MSAGLDWSGRLPTRPQLPLAAALAPLTADRVVLARVLAESRVERTPEPPGASYLGDLLLALTRALGGWIDRAGSKLSLPAATLGWAAVLLGAAALALVARAVVLRLRARQRRAPPANAADIAAGTPAAASRAWDAAAWRQELERRLAESRIREALEATWWWLARAVAGERAAATWTGADLLRWAGEGDARRGRGEVPELRDLVRRLDALVYGPRQPQAETVRELVARLEAVLT